MATSSAHNSACKTTHARIRAPLENPCPQLSNGAQMSSANVLHTELEPVESRPSMRSPVCKPFQEKRRTPAKSPTPKTINPRDSETMVRRIGLRSNLRGEGQFRKYRDHRFASLFEKNGGHQRNQRPRKPLTPGIQKKWSGGSGCAQICAGGSILNVPTTLQTVTCGGKPFKPHFNTKIQQ